MRAKKNCLSTIDILRLFMAALCLLLSAVTLSASAGPYDDGGMLRLVNRDEKLSKEYKPEDLVLPDVPTNKASQKESIYMRPDAASALEALFAAAPKGPWPPPARASTSWAWPWTWYRSISAI